MSLLSQNQQEPTKQELLARKAKRIKEFTRQGYRQILSIQQQGINMMWSDDDLTPQEIIDSIGAESIKVFQMHGALTDVIKTIASIDGHTPELALPANAFEIVDGAIVVTQDPYVAP
jgi:hypothetical protein